MRASRLTRLRRTAPAWLLAMAFVALIVAWLGSTPPGEGPDEQAHFIKAVAVGRGELTGTRGTFPAGTLGLGPTQIDWLDRTGRAFQMPSGLVPDGLECAAFKAETSAVCTNRAFSVQGAHSRLSYVGTYQPYLYVPPGLAVRVLGVHGKAALYVARGGEAIVCMVLLALAAALLWQPGRWGLPLVGLVLAATPTVLFLSAMVSANGPEICAGICFVAAMMRLTRPAPLPRWGWVAAALSGAVLAAARSLGPVYVVAEAAIVVAILGPRATRERLRDGGRWAAVAVVAVLVCLVAGAGWEITRQPHPHTTVSQAVHLIRPAFTTLRASIPWQMVGSFGWNEVQLPRVSVAVWLAAIAAVVVLAFVAGRRRDRLVLVAVVVVAVLASFAVYISVAGTAFRMQGRYVLPLVVAVPLVAGELLARGAGPVNRLRRAALPIVAVIVATPIHLLGWWQFARRSAVGVHGPRLFWNNSQWHPPGGWALWTGIALLGAGLLVVAGITGLMDGSAAAGDYRVATEPGTTSARSVNGPDGGFVPSSSGSRSSARR